jgi:uncharacterized membrane protein
VTQRQPSADPRRSAHQDQPHPSVIAQAEKRHADRELRIADEITKFAGSMHFVYLHAVLFAVRMLWFERSPWPS